LHIDGKLFRSQLELLMKIADLARQKWPYSPMPGEEVLAVFDRYLAPHVLFVVKMKTLSNWLPMANQRHCRQKNRRNRQMGEKLIQQIRRDGADVCLLLDQMASCPD
jgi:hypothetical protein